MNICQYVCRIKGTLQKFLKILNKFSHVDWLLIVPLVHFVWGSSQPGKVSEMDIKQHSASGARWWGIVNEDSYELVRKSKASSIL